MYICMYISLCNALCEWSAIKCLQGYMYALYVYGWIMHILTVIGDTTVYDFLTVIWIVYTYIMYISHSFSLSLSVFIPTYSIQTISVFVWQWQQCFCLLLHSHEIVMKHSNKTQVLNDCLVLCNICVICTADYCVRI